MSSKMKTYILIKKALLLSLIMTSPVVFAQNKDTLITIDNLYIDLTPPEVGASTILGLDPSKVSKPTSAKELSIDLLNLVSSGATVPNGIAIEWTPWYTFSNGNKSIIEYQKNPILSGLQLSFATVTDSATAKLAFGLEWSFDKSDPLIDKNLQTKIAEAQSKFLKNQPISGGVRANFLGRIRNFSTKIDGLFGLTNEEIFRDSLSMSKNLLYIEIKKEEFIPIPSKEILKKNIIAEIEMFSSKKLTKTETESILNTKELNDLVETYIELITELHRFSRNDKNKISGFISDHRKTNWNRFGVQVGLGHILDSPDKLWSSLESDKTTIYGSLSIPLNYSKMIKTDGSAGVGINFNPMISYSSASSTDSAQATSETFIGSRFILGYETIRFSFEGSYQYLKMKQSDFQDIKRYTIGLEVKATDGVWLEIVAGAEKNSEINSKASLISLASVKYALQNKRRIF